MVFLGIIILTIVLVLGIGCLLVRRWKQQELDRRKKRARVATGAAASAAKSVAGSAPVALGSTGLGQATALLPLPVLAAKSTKPVKLVVSVEQGEALVASLRAQVGAVYAAWTAAQAACAAWDGALNGRNNAWKKYTSSYFPSPKLEDPGTFREQVNERVAGIRGVRQAEATIVSTPKTLPPLWNTLERELARLKAMLKPVAYCSAAALPPQVVVARVLVQGVYERYQKYVLDNKSKYDKAIRKCLKGFEPFEIPLTAETPAFDQTVAEVYERLDGVFAAWKVANDNHLLGKSALSAYETAQIRANSWSSPPAFDALPVCLEQNQQRQLQLIEALAKLPDLASSLSDSRKSMEAALRPLRAIYVELKERPLLPAELIAIKQVLSNWLLTDYEFEKPLQACADTLAKMGAISKGTQPYVDADQEQLEQAIAQALEHLNGAAQVLFDVEKPVRTLKERVAALQAINERELVKLPEKPSEAAVADYLRQLDQPARAVLAASRAACQALQTVDVQLILLDRAYDLLNQSVARVVNDSNRLKPDLFASYSALKLAYRWIKEESDKHKKWRQETAGASKFEVWKSGAQSPDADDALRIAEMQKKMRSLGFAAAQLFVSKKKLQESKALAKPNDPTAPTLPDHSAEADFALLVLGAEAHLKEVATVRNECNRIDAIVAAANESVADRKRKLDQCRVALDECRQTAKASLHEGSAEDLRVLLYAASELVVMTS